MFLHACVCVCGVANLFLFNDKCLYVRRLQCSRVPCHKSGNTLENVLFGSGGKTNKIVLKQEKTKTSKIDLVQFYKFCNCNKQDLK